MHLQPANSDQLAVIEAVGAEYREMWSSIRPPYACDFTGTRTDIDALDFIEYEAGHHPRGVFGAALIWGNVIAKTELLSWLVSESGDYLLGELEYPRVLIWPLARTIEIEHSSPQYGKYEWLLEEAVARCVVQGFSEEEENRLLRTLDPEVNDGFSYYVPFAIEKIRQRTGTA
jgi:hypothetical protein